MAFNFFRHFITITKHRRLVRKYCWKSGLIWQGLTHDLSKYLPSEFISGAKYYQGTRSPNDLERRTNGYSKAWLHHKGINKHHLEYWTDYPQGGGSFTALDMPLRYIIESVCDRLAACRVYMGDEYKADSAYQYYLKSFPYYLISDATDSWFRIFLKDLSEHGDEHCFALMKHTLKTKEAADRASK